MPAKIVYLRSIEKHPYKDELKRKLEQALQYFPELSGEEIYVGILPEKDPADGKADGFNRIVKFSVDRPPTFVTVFHELMHLAIHKRKENGEKLPETEEFCSIAAMARMPPEFVDEDWIPYIGRFKISRESIPELCRSALEYRRRHRNYIQFLRKRLEVKP